MFEVVAVSALVILLSVTAIFLVATARRDNSIMDICYGLVFIATSTTTFFLFSDYSLISVVALLLTLVWGLRLSIRIFLKNKGKGEDRRYALWRAEWQKKGSVYTVVRSFLQVFLLQGFIIWIVSLPVVLVHSAPPEWGILATLGFLIWLTGFAFEVVADYQLDAFIKNPDNRGKIMTGGLFRYSRRPNYFGESLMWWGLAVMAVSNPALWFVFLSPLVITYVVVYITGPITERMWDGNEAYQEYKRRTSYFIPLPPTSV